GLDVKGKIVLVLRHVPNEKAMADKREAAARAKQRIDDKKMIAPMDGMFSVKARFAQGRGAVGMLVVTEPSHEHDDEFSLSADLRVPITDEEKAAAEKKKAEADKKKAERATAAASAATAPKVSAALAKGKKPADEKRPVAPPFVSAIISRAAGEE